MWPRRNCVPQSYLVSLHFAHSLNQERSTFLKFPLSLSPNRRYHSRRWLKALEIWWVKHGEWPIFVFSYPFHTYLTGPFNCGHLPHSVHGSHFTRPGQFCGKTWKCVSNGVQGLQLHPEWVKLILWDLGMRWSWFEIPQRLFPTNPPRAHVIAGPKPRPNHQPGAHLHFGPGQGSDADRLQQFPIVIF